jgi:hypothetical protein
MRWPILEGHMGIAHGAEELGLCSHGLACQAGAWGRYIGFRLRNSIWDRSDFARLDLVRCSYAVIYSEICNAVTRQSILD